MKKTKIFLFFALAAVGVGLINPLNVFSAQEQSSQSVFSNCVITRIGTSAPEPALPAECTDGARTGEIPSADRAALLTRVKELALGGKITFAKSNDREGMTSGSGKVTRSDGAIIEIDTQVLRSFIFLADQGFTFEVFSLIGGHSKLSSSDNVSRHWDGHAYDVSIINGQVINQTSAKDETIKFLKAFNALIGKDLTPSQLISGGNSPNKNPILDPENIALNMNNHIVFEGYSIGLLSQHTNHVHVGY